MKWSRRTIFLLLVLFCCTGWQQDSAGDKQNFSELYLKTTKAPISNINIINVSDHNPESFTQGLAYYKGYLYESTGLNGKSTLRKLDIKSGQVVKNINLNKQYFGEGMSILDNKIYQLTWQSQTGFIYDLQSFRKTGEFHYQGEGWGLTNDGKNLIMSNGTPLLVYLNPKTFKIIRKIMVYDGELPVANLNELEFIRGEIWANVFMEDFIVRISPETGKVLGWINLKVLHAFLSPAGEIDVLNGIAYDQEGDRIFITGKFWPKLFEIKVIR